MADEVAENENQPLELICRRGKSDKEQQVRSGEMAKCQHYRLMKSAPMNYGWTVTTALLSDSYGNSSTGQD